MMRDAIEIKFPEIPWRVPMPVQVFGLDAPRFCCRICVAHYGLKAREIDIVPYCFADEADHRKHMESHHQ